MIVLNRRKALAFDDVLLIPQYSEIKSRKDVSTSVNFLGRKLEVPVISSNMTCVTGANMAQAMHKSGGLGCLPRFVPIANSVQMFLASKHNPMVSIGLGHSELERAIELAHLGANIFVVDVAHGAHSEVVAQTKMLRRTLGPVWIVAGNFATGESMKRFLHEGGIMDAAKIGIGGGCFGAGTRILMSNGSYKNIEDVIVGDRVINKNGQPVNVIGTKVSGIKNVVEYKSNLFYKSSYATPDHRHWVGDYSTIKDINDHSMIKILDKLTKKEESKFKWKALKDANKSCLLLPKVIKFELPEKFQINFKDYFVREINFIKSHNKEIIEPSYNLGYIFGTFLGDGNSRLGTYKKSTRGSVHWCFGLKEVKIANKLCTALKECFNINSNIKQIKNVNIVHSYSMPLSKLLYSFGKRKNKHLPIEYICNNNEYLKGLFDGLLDSDGHYANDGRISLQNTSSSLIELFGFLHYKLRGYYPSMIKRNPSIGGFLTCDITNFNESYTARSVNNPKNYLTKDYQINRINNYKECVIAINTYDIEVDDDTHSFIANNAIVHNSACTTRLVTGCGLPTFQSIVDCAELGIPVIADGGIRNSGDMAKALAAGADVVMCGKLLVGTDESAAEFAPPTLYGDMIQRKIYRGSASYESYEVQGKHAEWRTAEGEQFYVDCVGPVASTLQKLTAGLRSAMSYVGASDLEELKANAEFTLVSGASARESGAHGKY